MEDEDKCEVVEYENDFVVAMEDENKLDMATEDEKKLDGVMEDENKLAGAMEDENKQAVAIENENKLSANMEDENRLAVAMEDENRLAVAMTDENILALTMGDENTLAVEDGNRVSGSVDVENRLALTIEDENRLAVAVEDENRFAVAMEDENSLAVAMEDENRLSVATEGEKKHLAIEDKKLITICHFGGEFETNKDGFLFYSGGEAHAIDINNETQFEDFKLEIFEMLNCTSGVISIKYFLLGNRKTAITVSTDKDFRRMISFNANSPMVDVYVTAGQHVANDLSNMPGSRSSRTTLSEDEDIVDAPGDGTPLGTRFENVLDAKDEAMVDTPIDMTVDITSPFLPLESSDPKHYKVPASWENAITGVSQRFANVNEFREALRKYAMAHKFAYRLKKNDSHRVTAKCKSDSCPWRIHASKLSTTQLFCIKRMNAKHTCEGSVLAAASHAKTIWVAGIVKEKLRDCPKYKPRDIIIDMKREYGVELSYYQAYKGKEIATEQLRGSYKESYSQLPLLCEKIMETNPGSFATFTTKEDSSFHRLFISFHAMLQGFQLGCRPLLFLDSLPLNTKYQSTLLFATAADGDDGVFPVSFAVVDDVNAENWHWFLTELKSAIPISEITFIAHTDSGLRESIPEVFEKGFHSYCVHLLSEKFKKDLPTHFSHEVQRLLVGDFYTAAHALKQEEFQRSTESIKGISPEAFDWVMNNRPDCWSNAFFEGNRYNHMTSKFGEGFYSWLSEAYELPITQMVHAIQVKMTELIDTRRVNSSQWSTRLTPSMEGKLQQEIIKAQSLQFEIICLPDSDTIFDVRCGDFLERVDIDQLFCSCKEWKINGLPCCHAIAVLWYLGRNPHDYCSGYFTTEYYRLTYSMSINPVPVPAIPDVEKPTQKEPSQEIVSIIPPPTRTPTRRPPGRPKNFSPNVTTKEPDKRKVQCSKCKGLGHNKSTCKVVV